MACMVVLIVGKDMCARSQLEVPDVTIVVDFAYVALSSLRLVVLVRLSSRQIAAALTMLHWSNIWIQSEALHGVKVLVIGRSLWT